jgi:hypothetical protein
MKRAFADALFVFFQCQFTIFLKLKNKGQALGSEMQACGN